VDFGIVCERKSMTQFSYCGWASMCLEAVIRVVGEKRFDSSN
jgi:hypothetical protein